LGRLLELLLAERGRMLTDDEVAILDLALAATYSGEWRDASGRLARGGFFTDPSTHRAERTPLMCDLLYVLRHASTCLPPVNADLVQSLAARLARYVEGLLGDFFSQPTHIA